MVASRCSWGPYSQPCHSWRNRRMWKPGHRWPRRCIISVKPRPSIMPTRKNLFFPDYGRPPIRERKLSSTSWLLSKVSTVGRLLCMSRLISSEGSSSPRDRWRQRRSRLFDRRLQDSSACIARTSPWRMRLFFLVRPRFCRRKTKPRLPERWQPGEIYEPGYKREAASVNSPNAERAAHESFAQVVLPDQPLESNDWTDHALGAAQHQTRRPGVGVGAGSGLSTNWLRHHCSDLTCLEIDFELASKLHRRFSESDVKVFCGGATQMPFADCSFSNAVSFTMLHHLSSSPMQDR